MENRHRARKLAFKALFSWELNKSTTFTDILIIESNLDRCEIESEFGERIFSGVLNNIETIDNILSRHLDNWELERLNKIDLSILRLSIFSLSSFKDISEAVTINEAINISKEFGTNDSYKFINGVLDSLVMDLGAVLLK